MTVPVELQVRVLKAHGYTDDRLTVVDDTVFADVEASLDGVAMVVCEIVPNSSLTAMAEWLGY